MAAASSQVTSFLGGEWSQAMQGRTDRPDYRAAMNVCLNALPIEQGAWCRRSGTAFCQTTRGGVSGRVVNFEFKSAAPYAMELTAGHLRFFSGTTLIYTNDAQTVVSISSATPAVVTTGTHGWATGDQVYFSGMSGAVTLQNRVLAITVLSSTTFSIADAVSGASIAGSGLGFGTGSVRRVLDLATPFVGTLWQTVRTVAADIPIAVGTTPGAVLLNGSIAPQVLQVATAPTASANATFTLAAAALKDGPYFDPVPGGTLATPSAKIGNITLTLAFNAYDSTRSYSIGDYVTSSSVNYKSLTDANVGNTPVSSPSNWTAVSAADAIGPNGFTGGDTGRHIRLYSEPAIWASGTTYALGDVVAYGGSGNQYIGATYWKALVGTNTGNVPGVDLTKWVLFPSGAIWTWGKITGLSNIIDRALAGSASIGDMTSGGGLAAAFDGNFSQAASASAEKAQTISGSGSVSGSSYVGKNYSAASDQKIAQAVVYPSADFGIVGLNAPLGGATMSIVLNLRGKASLPASASDGTLIGTTTLTASTTAPVLITSTDQSTSWKYVWVEIVVTITFGGAFAFTATNTVCELSLFNPPGTGTSQGVTVQIIGDALLYTTAIRNWRLGLYNNNTGWPTCGTYHEGRLWLSGAIGNRIDGSKSNDIFNLAPTNADGSVSGNSAIAYTFNAPEVNPVFWMVPDHQGIICGTQAGEWLVQATAANSPLTPTTIQAHRVTTNRCANIEPRRSGLTLAVVHAYKRRILEYFADVYSSKFTAYNLALTAKHLTVSGIQEIAYQHELAPVIWARTGAGSLIGTTYKRESLVSSNAPDFAGWHRHTLGSGRTVESIAVSGNADGTLDALMMVTNDAASGIRHVEMMQPLLEEAATLSSAWLLDDADNPTSTSTTATPSAGAPYGGLTINGLWYLNGKSVSVFAGGLDCGDYAVSSGSITVPYGDGISAGTASGLFTAAFAAGLSLSQIVVGFCFTSDGQLVRPSTPADSGARNGPAFGKLRRSHWFAIQVANTSGLSIGTNFSKLYAIPFKNLAGQNLQPGNTYTGIARDALLDDYSLDGMLCWRATRMLPAIVASVGTFIHTQDL